MRAQTLHLRAAFGIKAGNPSTFRLIIHGSMGKGALKKMAKKDKGYGERSDAAKEQHKHEGRALSLIHI